MKPGLALLGFVLGTAAAITFSLTGVMIVFFALRSEYPRLEGEIAPLATHLGLFVALTVLAALSFYAEIKRPPWRVLSLAGLAMAVAGLVVFYWPA